MPKTVILGAARTPIGKMGGGLSSLDATALGGVAIEAALQRAIRSPDVADKLKAMAVNPGGGPADEFSRMIDADIKTYSDVVKSANLTFEE